jgi:signal peptidase II
MSMTVSDVHPKGPTRPALFAYGAALVAIALDQASKYWVVNVLDLPDRFQYHLSQIFNLTMVWNDGVSYGLFKAQGGLGRWVLALFSFAVAAGLAIWIWRGLRVLPAVGVGLIMGGAIGNALDRVRIGRVVDFLDFSGTHVFPWVFNVADSAITVGVVLLLLDSLSSDRRRS